jgi:DNA-binding XRE family transcriptional regulator
MNRRTASELRDRAARAREQLAGKPGPDAILTAQERADAAPFYFELRGFIQQLKQSRLDQDLTLEAVAGKTGLAVETLSRLETGAVTNPTWKTLGTYAAAVGMKIRLTAEAG